MTSTSPLRVLVIGGYGLIGASCIAALRAEGLIVVGMGRSRTSADRVARDIPWHIADIVNVGPGRWDEIFSDIDVVVNASGILQDGLNDSLMDIHVKAVMSMMAILHGSGKRFVQISAAGASINASTEFMSTKACGDAQIIHTDIDWFILRPALVLSPNAYGGTALLRASAAFPHINAALFEDSLIQTVSVDDVARAVVKCVKGEVPARRVYDLAEDTPHTLGDLTEKMRAWQGFPPNRIRVPVPAFAARALGWGGDVLGHLGWRPAVRSTSLRVLADGVRADPSAWREVTGAGCGSLDETLARLPSTVQERWFASLYMLMPLAIACLSLFWILSGAIGIVQHAEASAMLTARGLSQGAANAVVFGGGLIDLALGMMILVRRYARAACLGMIAVSLGYLAGGTLFAPDLWADPIGPLVKVLPAIVLTLFARSLIENR